MAEISLLWRVSGLRSFILVWRNKGSTQAQWKQLRWLKHLARMPPEYHLDEMLWVCPTVKRHHDKPSTCCRDYISQLAWEAQTAQTWTGSLKCITEWMDTRAFKRQTQVICEKKKGKKSKSIFIRLNITRMFSGTNSLSTVRSLIWKYEHGDFCLYLNKLHYVSTLWRCTRHQIHKWTGKWTS